MGQLFALAEPVHAADDPGSAPIKVLIADDHPIMLAGLRRAFERFDDVEIVGEAHSGPALLAAVERRRPDVVLTDLRMPGANGADCIEWIREHRPEVRVVVLSASEDRASVDSALAAGASSYILKSASLMDVVSVVRQGSSPFVFHAVRPSERSHVVDSELGGPDLTSRERLVLGAVAAGRTTIEISRQLWVTDHTVKFHLTNIYRKVGVTNRAGAVRYALEHGIVADDQ
jgi:DNA-binding NarL/FixJ family response regulator